MHAAWWAERFDVPEEECWQAIGAVGKTAQAIY